MLDIFSGSFELEDYHGARLLRVALSDLSEDAIAFITYNDNGVAISIDTMPFGVSGCIAARNIIDTLTSFYMKQYDIRPLCRLEHKNLIEQLDLSSKGPYILSLPRSVASHDYIHFIIFYDWDGKFNLNLTIKPSFQFIYECM